jgi:transposase
LVVPVKKATPSWGRIHHQQATSCSPFFILKSNSKDMKKKTANSKKATLPVINPQAAGIDVASMVHYVAVPAHLCDRPVRHFGTFTSDLEALAAWLVSLGITTVAMESTGNYWLSLYEVLEARGMSVCLVNARHLKNVSGRKTDVSDCQWLQQLHSYGLLAPSFIPDELTRQLRSYVRQRQALEKEKARDLQHLHRSLTNMNLKLQHLISDIEGVAGMQVIAAIAGGETNAQELARFHNKAMKASPADFVSGLQGNYRAEHVFCLQQALESYRFHVKQMRDCEAKIEQLLAAMGPGVETVDPADFVGRTKSRKVRKNQYSFELSSYLKQLLGVDLTQVAGMGEDTVLEVLAETGTDLSKWPSAKHFTSWLKLCPNPAKSGGKVLGHKSTKTSSRAAQAFRLAARSLHSSQHYLGVLYRRISHKKGAATAIKAVARKLAVIFYQMVRNKTPYTPGQHVQQQEKMKDRMIKNLKKKARALGLELQNIANTQETEKVLII